jgi:hypothetical protein
MSQGGEMNEAAGMIQSMTQALGQVQGQLQALERAQGIHAQSMREDIKGIHGRIEALSRETGEGFGKLYRDGCARAPDHEDVEKRMRDVESWKIGHDAEVRTLARASGGVSGGIWGAIAATASAAAAWILTHLSTGGQQ